VQELPAWYDRPQRELPWWRRLTLRRLAESKPVRVLFYVVAVPWLVIEGIGALMLTFGLVWAVYKLVALHPLAIFLFPPTWFIAWWLLTDGLWRGVAWLLDDLPRDIAFWWNEWRVHRGSRVPAR
jgi:hypothetical protein